MSARMDAEERGSVRPAENGIIDAGAGKRVPLAVDEIEPQLAAYMAQFRRVFLRKDVVLQATRYVVALMSELPRKNGQTMAERIEGIHNRQAIHQLLRISPWSAEQLDQERVRHALRVASTGRDAALIIDETSVLKQGRRSVGTKRQYLGCVGKTANGQVAVTLHYQDDRHDWPVTGRLYLPQDWATNTQLRQESDIPDEVQFLTKPQIALDLLRRVRTWDLPPATVIADLGYCDLNVLSELDDQHVPFCLGAAADFRVRLPGKQGALCRVDQLAARMTDDQWQSVTYRDGTKEPLVKEFVAVRVQAATAQANGPQIWLLMERSPRGHQPDPKYYVLDADRKYTLQGMARLAHRRWLIERFSYENAKNEAGLADYQGRTWRGFHHHLALVMLALTWLNLQRRQLPPSSRTPPPVATQAGRVRRTVTVTPPGSGPIRLQTALFGRPKAPPPRQIWESVQSVRARFVDWCAATVMMVFARRGHYPLRTTFVSLC